VHFEVFARQFKGAEIAGWGVDYNVKTKKITTHLTHKPDIDPPSNEKSNGRDQM
jgi:hypothetical protein